MELGHLLTRPGLTYPEISSNVYHDSFCQLASSISLPWVIYFEAFFYMLYPASLVFQQSEQHKLNRVVQRRLLLLCMAVTGGNWEINLTSMQTTEKPNHKHPDQ